MIEKIRNIFAIPELRKKIIFTLGILVIVRLGSQVPIPGINPDALRQTMESLNDTFFGLFNLFTGHTGASPRYFVWAAPNNPFEKDTSTLQEM